MKEIILKDLYQQRYLLIGGGLLLILTALIPTSVGFLWLSLPAYVVPLVVMVMGVLIVESGEEKNFGYVLLSTLPISRMGVIGAKYFTLLGESFGFSMVSLAVLSLKSDGQGIPMSLSVFTAIGFSTILMISVLTFAGIYILGLKNFTRAMLVLMISVQLIVFVMGVQRFNGVDRSQAFLQTISTVLQWHPIALVGVGLFLWSGLLLFTAQFRKRI